MKKVKDGNEVWLWMDEGYGSLFLNIAENDFDYESIWKSLSASDKIYIYVIEVKKGFFTLEDMWDGFVGADFNIPVHVKESLEKAKKSGHLVSHNKVTIDTQTPDGGRKEYDKWVKAFEKKHIVDVKKPKKKKSHTILNKT